MMWCRALAVLLLAAPMGAAAAQVVLNRDGSLPAPSVSAEEFPSLVRCTLAKHAPDIEAYLLGRKARFDAAFAAGRVPTARDYEGLRVAMADGSSLEQERVMVRVIESCQPLKEGYPLGFWPETLEAEWSKALAVVGYEASFKADDFVRCLSTYRPEILKRYLATETGEARSAMFNELKTQPVCRPKFPAALHEKLVFREARALQE